MSRTCGRGRAADGGFTLVEIMIALAILGGVVVVLLDQRVKAVRDAQRVTEQRLAWTLAAWKMSEIELDEELLSGPDAADAGTFEDYAPEYAAYVWEYETERVRLKTYDEEDAFDEGKEVFRVALKVRRADDNAALAVLGALFPAGELEP